MGACVVGIICAVIGTIVPNIMGEPADAPLEWLSKDAVSCGIHVSEGGFWVEFGIDDAADVKTLVMEPLRSHPCEASSASTTGLREGVCE